jgi:23S rRNA pseudouridine1911/1915/1917 synthase
VPQTRRVFTGQRVTVRLVEPPDKILDTDPRPIRIIYEDPWIVVVDKPAGVIAHPTGEFQKGSLINILQHWLDERSSRRGLIRPGLMHRLDRQTSGLMVVALQHVAHRGISAAFEAGRVSKSYIALVEGRLREKKGTIAFPIGRTPTGKNVLMSCRAEALDARPSQTNYELIEQYRDHALVLAKPLTGRNHQIRVHFAHIGHPLVGDEFYLPFGNIRPLRNDAPPSDEEDEELEVDGIETGLPIRRHALHAVRLAFAHPITNLWLEFNARLPEDFTATIAELRGSAEHYER